jgi:hypothetical protein
MLSKDGFVRNFYEVLKNASGETIKRMFITGVTPITLDSLTSGFNNAKNVSTNVLLNDMIGFTSVETENALKLCNIPIEKLNVLKENYDGYLFNKDGKNHIYNSTLVLYYLSEYVMLGTEPDNLIDRSVTSDVDKINGLFDLYNNEEDKEIIIKDILNDKMLNSHLVDKFNISTEFGSEEFISLLFYLGQLTIVSEEADFYSFKIPNIVIKKVYYEYYFHYLNKVLDNRIDTRFLGESFMELRNYGKLDKFMSIIETRLKAISNRDYMNLNEKNIKFLFFANLGFLPDYYVKSELEVEQGYIDLLLKAKKSKHYNILIEIKYLKKNEINLLEEKRLEGINQINKYCTSREIQDLELLKKYLIVFVNDECKILEEI